MILSLLLSVSAMALELPDMSAYELLEGEYSQTRVIKEVDAKLKSSGRFEVGPKVGITWAQAKPFENSMTIRDRKIISNSGTARAADPISLEISSTILSVFKNDLDALSKNFVVEKSGKTGDWKLSLVPKAKQLKAMIKSITVQGKKFVNAVSIDEASGGSIQIQFSKVKAAK